MVAAELVASDADDDPIEFRVTSAPVYGELRAYLAGSGVIGEMFFDEDDETVDVAVTSDGRYAVLAIYGSGLRIIDVSNP